MVFWQALESITHSIVPHCREVEALEIGKQEGISRFVPSTVADGHGIGGVLAAPSWSEVVSHLGQYRMELDSNDFAALNALKYVETDVMSSF